MLQLSHSKKEKYLTCPAAYHIHYNLRLSTIKQYSALPFGTAYDNALDELLHSKNLNNSIETFNKYWNNPEINGVEVTGKDCPNLFYYSKDFDRTLFKNEELSKEILEQLKQLDNQELTPVGKKHLQEQLRVLGLSHESLRRKGELFLKAYHDQILPKIKEVLATQKEISLKNNIGDEIIGKADLICEWEDGTIRLIDNKTASQTYSKDKIDTEGGQLALYYEALKDEYKIDLVGYLVTEKNLLKKERNGSRAKIQELFGEVPTHLTDKTIEEFDQVAIGIKSGHFQSNHPNCHQPWYNATEEVCPCQMFKTDSYDGFTSIKRNYDKK